MAGVEVASGYHAEYGMVVILKVWESGVMMTLPFQLPEAAQLRDTITLALDHIEGMLEV